VTENWSVDQPPPPPSTTPTDTKRKSSTAEWVQAISLAILALAAVVFVADLLYIQYSLAQAAEQVGNTIRELSEQFGGGAAEEPTAPCTPEPGNFDC
jgi:hypothetical protein